MKYSKAQVRYAAKPMLHNSARGVALMSTLAVIDDLRSACTTFLQVFRWHPIEAKYCC